MIKKNLVVLGVVDMRQLLLSPFDAYAVTKHIFRHFTFVQIKNSENFSSNHGSFLRKIRMRLHKENGHIVLLFGHMVVIAKEVFYSRSKPLQ